MTHSLPPLDMPEDEGPFSHLPFEQARALLTRARVGRIAFSEGNRIDIEPIGFIYDDGWLFGRTSFGTKLAALGSRPWVAFEIDEMRGPFDWESVVVHGSFHVLQPEGAASEIELYERAVKRLRESIPDYGTSRDPGAFRTTVFGIHMNELVGRRASLQGR